MRRAKARYVAGIRFTSEGRGLYFSECGRFVISHQFEGRTIGQWELYQLDVAVPAGCKTRTWDGAGDMLDCGPTLDDVRAHYAGQLLFPQRAAADNVPYRRQHTTTLTRETKGPTLTPPPDAIVHIPVRGGYQGDATWLREQLGELIADFDEQVADDRKDGKDAECRGLVMRSEHLYGSAAALNHAAKQLRRILAGKTYAEALREAGHEAGQWALAQVQRTSRRVGKNIKARDKRKAARRGP